ncbi:MAG: hypothetical protein NXH70_04090 [Hyphomonas sp.]|nr:hypothetical protein [Hyphomonas sp.]
MARPKKEETAKRSHVAQARLSLEEKATLTENAKQAGLSESDYIRARCLGHQIHPPKTRLDQAAIARLNRIGVQLAGACNNTNQLARAVHRGSDFQHYWLEVGAELRSARAQLRIVLTQMLASLDEDAS